MRRQTSVGTKDFTAGGAGCLLSIPLVIAAAFRFALKYAQNKEHQFSHQVEDVQLEGIAAAKLDEGIHPKEALKKFVKKLNRVTEQYSKMGGRFSPEDFKGQKERLQDLRERISEPDPEAQALFQEAQRSLMQYAPEGS